MNAQTEERLFDLSRDDDQRMNQDTMTRFAEHEIRAVAKEADEAGATPAGFYDKTAELGLSLLPIPEALGGAGMARSPVSNALNAEDLAWGDLALTLGAVGQTQPVAQFEGSIVNPTYRAKNEPVGSSIH